MLKNIPKFDIFSSKIVLLYSASEHGWMRKDFHSRVDGKGPTLSIVLSSKNKLSCGYTSVSWDTKGGQKSDSTAWLMSLDTLTVYPIKEKSSYAVLHDHCRSISFGGGPHLAVGRQREPMNEVDASMCYVSSQDSSFPVV